MRIEIDERAWSRGFWDGDSGKPSNACPYAINADECLSWVSGYIEGKAFRNGYSATPPGSRVPLRKKALAAEPYAVPLRSTAAGSAAKPAGKVGSKLRADWGSIFGAD